MTKAWPIRVKPLFWFSIICLHINRRNSLVSLRKFGHGLLKRMDECFGCLRQYSALTISHNKRSAGCRLSKRNVHRHEFTARGTGDKAWNQGDTHTRGDQRLNGFNIGAFEHNLGIKTGLLTEVKCKFAETLSFFNTTKGSSRSSSIRTGSGCSGSALSAKG